MEHTEIWDALYEQLASQAKLRRQLTHQAEQLGDLQTRLDSLEAPAHPLHIQTQKESKTWNAHSVDAS